ncbi:MAG: energy transducer TonB [Pseudobdellovibrionaceae bacterium]
MSKVAVRTARQVKEAEPNQLVAKMTSSGESESSTLPAEASSANWLQSQVRYPQEALEKNQQGQARFNLIYDENGELKSLEIAEAPIASSLKRETLRLKKVIEENRARFSAKHFANEQVVLPLVFRIMK